MEDHSASTFDDLNFDAMVAGITAVPLRSIAAERPALFERLRAFDPVRLAAVFGSLLAAPELQSNCIRLEALVHLSLAIGNGIRQPDAATVRELFAALSEGACGRCEDPAEDVFVGSISTPRGNFRVLEGTWESSAFFLQRFLDAVEKMPDGGGYDTLRDDIYALLRLSDAVCQRAGLARYQLGNDIPEQNPSDEVVANLDAVQRRVQFSDDELSELEISIEHLEAFGFIPDERQGLLDQAIGHSMLERCPVLFRRGELCLVLPTAVSSAIRRYVIERMDAAGQRDRFLAGLAREYAENFARTPLLGSEFGAPIAFRRTASSISAAVMAEVERGRFLNFVFMLDTLDGFETDGLAGRNPDRNQPQADINATIDEACAFAQRDAEFRDGITLVVVCGVGRATVLSLKPLERPGWGLECISAADLYTLSWLPDFKPLALWRLAEAEAKVQSLGVTLQNMNGLLNMVAWARSLDGHLVPHAQLPDDFMADHESAFIMINQNSLRDLRHEVATTWDVHVEQNLQGQWIKVRREASSAFQEDREQPLYASTQKIEGAWPSAIYAAGDRSWWGEIAVPSGTDGEVAHQRWKMMTLWLTRAVPVLEANFPELPTGPMLWRLRFDGPVGKLANIPERVDLAAARAELSITARKGCAEITVAATPTFERAHFNDDNIAERALVEKLVEGAALAAGRGPDESDCARPVAAIVPDNRARQTHMFHTQAVRDYIQGSLPRTPLLLDEMDAATFKLGLAWRVRDKKEVPEIRGKADCLAYLGALVRSIEDDLCAALRRFDRLATTRMLLRHHEAAAVDRERWLRTASATLSLANRKAEALETMARHDFELNAVFQATRLLTEIALCECPLSGGRTPAPSDLSMLMAQIMAVQEFGGWSDAIRWDAMEPHLKITALGDVRAKLGFVGAIIAPFARITADMRVADAVEGYAANLVSAEAEIPVDDVFEAQFLDAWMGEAGATLDDFLSFVAHVEHIAVEQREGFLTLPLSRLQTTALENASLSPATTAAIVAFLSLRSRPKWREVPEGFRDSDRQPWRFRRQLSVLRKPLLQLDGADDPMIAVAPGLLRDAFVYTVRNYHRGDFPLRQLKPKMRSWTGTVRDRAGRLFSDEVAARLCEFGWQTESEVKITKLLRKHFDRDYGDVDVLAWNPASGRVLIIECKDVQYRKIHGEIAEQLADFRGEATADGKRDDLRKHLDRVDLVTRHLPAVSKHIGATIPNGVESHLVFKNPVPMEFALKHMAERVAVSIFDRLIDI